MGYFSRFWDWYLSGSSQSHSTDSENVRRSDEQSENQNEDGLTVTVEEINITVGNEKENEE